jgi:hypothetical protein
MPILTGFSYKTVENIPNILILHLNEKTERVPKRFHGCIAQENGTKVWYKDDELHRDNDLPAIETTNGDKFYYKNGIEYDPQAPTTTTTTKTYSCNTSNNPNLIGQSFTMRFNDMVVYSYPMTKGFTSHFLKQGQLVKVVDFVKEKESDVNGSYIIEVDNVKYDTVGFAPELLFEELPLEWI